MIAEVMPLAEKVRGRIGGAKRVRLNVDVLDR